MVSVWKSRYGPAGSIDFSNAVQRSSHLRVAQIAYLRTRLRSHGTPEDGSTSWDRPPLFHQDSIIVNIGPE